MPNYRGFSSLESRMLALETRLDRRLDRVGDELRTFKDVVNGKFAALDLEIAKLMDRG